MSKEIVMSKLITGEVVMGKSRGDVDHKVTIERPFILMLDPMQGGIGMMPYDIHFTEKEISEITIREEHILHYIDCSDQFKKAYIKQTIGIELVKNTNLPK